MASLPTKPPHQQAQLPFAYPFTYFLISSYMLRMLFVGFLLALANLGGLVLVANPLMEQQPPSIS
jgi:hypothetical protein